jgi:hypothetical protein
MIVATLYSCTNYREELSELQTKCDSLQNVIDDLNANCINVTKLPKSSSYTFNEFITETKTDAENNITKFDQFATRKGYNTVTGSKGVFISNQNLFTMLRDAINSNAVGVYVNNATDSEIAPRFFRYYYTPVSCSTDQSNNFEFTPLADYKYSDIGCPMHCSKY